MCLVRSKSSMIQLLDILHKEYKIHNVTSAPLVNIPPPRRAKIEINEAPKDNATKASINNLVSTFPLISVSIITGDRSGAQTLGDSQNDIQRVMLHTVCSNRVPVH